MSKWPSQLKKWGLYLWAHRPVWGRALLCGLAGLAVLWAGLRDNHDLRFRVRGLQPVDSSLVLLEVGRGDLMRIQHPDHMERLEAEDFPSLWDAFWKEQKKAGTMLEAILRAKPRIFAVAVPVSRAVARDLSERPGTLWTISRVDSETGAHTNERLRKGMAFLDFGTDADGVVRRTPWFLRNANSFEGRVLGNSVSAGDEHSLTSGKWINYRGPAGSFPTIRWSDLAAGRVSLRALAGKRVIVGTSEARTQSWVTPMGPMGIAELAATVVDNSLQNRWPQQFPLIIYFVYMALVLTFFLWVMNTYTQSVVTVALVFSCVWVGSLSAWVFDRFYYWLPVFAPWSMLIFGAVVFMSYQIAFGEQRTWRLEQERFNLIELEKLKDNFLSLISHDLKTPIAKIQAICDRLLTTNESVQLRNDLKSLKASSQDLHRYIHSILQLSRVEARELKIQKDAGDINEIVNRVVRHLEPLAAELGVQIETELEPLFSIEFDSILMAEVVLNLVENAVKYTGRGGRVLVTTREVGDQVEVWVKDTGPGIALEDQPRVWEKFFRTRGATTSGSGLGLYLVKYFVELHGGRVFLNSELGNGTQIGFGLPMGFEAPEESKHVSA